MSTAWNELEITAPKRAAWKSPAEAYGISTILHALVFGLLSALTLLEAPTIFQDGLTAHFNQNKTETDLLEPDPIRPVELSAEAGGSESSSVSFIASSTDTKVSAPELADTSLPVPTDTELNSANLATYVGALAGTGRGGNGDGEGQGNGHGFFGDPGSAKSFVFVLDRSRSMNKDHQLSNGLSRFQRLKMELIGFIDKLQPDQTFFVVFFNDQMSPMPAEGLVPATAENKQKYLKWIASANADDGTDPRLSIRLAMKLEQEMIYFLSDGEVEPDYRAQMLTHE
ncbi:MAG: VWA domain-containing protein, partial [Planctomycetaceae bacterium]|nr:VWA domain-containing protein [Planctomycetaceae bacterium]